MTVIGLIFSGFCAALPAAADDVKYATDVSSRLNPTGRTVAFGVPLKDGGQGLGDVTIEITADDKIRIQKSEFAARAAPLMAEAERSRIAALAGETGFVPIEQFAEAGVKVRFDSGLQELQLELTPDQRPVGDLDFGGRPVQRASSELAQPEFFAGYLNIIAGLDEGWGTLGGASGGAGTGSGDGLGGRLELESAVRIGNFVFENRGEYDGAVDANICPIGATCTYGHVAGLKRQSSRIVYDLPAEEIRVQAGDTDPVSIPLQRSADVLGVSVEKSAHKLNPGDNESSMGSGSFRLESNSSVDVIVNGAVVQRLQLRPGNYNLRDLPLTAGANTIELTITADNGERRTLSFSSYSDPRLLAGGKSEWAFAAGVPSYLFDNARTYGNEYLATGFVRYGLNDGLTGEADLQGDSDIVMGGVGADFETAAGMFGLHAAASTGTPGNGAAANADWSLSNFNGITTSLRENLNANAEYRSPDFHTPGEFLNGADGIVYSEFNYWLRLGASYSVPVTDDITATLSGRYQFGDESRKSLSPFTFNGDRYGADLTLSAALGPTVNASLLMGYSNELIERSVVSTLNQDAEYRVALRFNVRPDDATSLSAGYDTLGQQAQVSAYRSGSDGIDHWDTSIDVQDRTVDETASVNASAGYRGNRVELRLSHFADADGVTFADPAGTSVRQRTSLRIGTGIAFAGGKFAIGAPVRGGAFAIVSPHNSIADKTITIGSTGSERAIADRWGNALVSDLPAYMPGSLPIDVDDLPLGYSLGSGAFDTFAPYKAGYAIEVGSAYSVSVYGTFVLADGQPVSLVTGTAHPDGKPDKQVTLFTNAEGKFGAEGMAPGRWIVDMATDAGAISYVIDVPAGSNGLIKAGTLYPAEGSAQ
jgi:outer membrane usher protein